jgi:hypothetical protein
MWDNVSLLFDNKVKVDKKICSVRQALLWHKEISELLIQTSSLFILHLVVETEIQVSS